MTGIKHAVIYFLTATNIIYGQQTVKDSLLMIINKHNGDKLEVNALAHYANNLTDFDSAFNYAQQGFELAEKINDQKGKADCLLMLSIIVDMQANHSSSIKYGLNALNIYELINNKLGIASVHGSLQATFRTIGDFKSSLAHAFRSLEISESNPGIAEFTIPGHSLIAPMYAEIGQTYLLMGQLDSAIYFTQKAIDLKEKFDGSEWNFPVYLLATIQTIKGSYKSALENFKRAVPLAVKNGIFRDTLQIFSGISTLFKKTGQLDSAIHYAQMVVTSTNPELETKNLMEAVVNLAEIYKTNGNKDSVIKYIELNNKLRDSILSNEKNREIQNITFNENLKQQELVAAQLKYKNRVQLYVLAGGIFILVLISVILWRNNRHKQKAKEKIEKAYSELKITQAQLVQSEKMASLGELTAGIAHEIQNPLNFVNNFSDVNKELLAEMNGEIEKGNYDEVKSIAKDITDNEGKINHHGKRADAIVKNMLQHSRSGSGKKEPTDINALAEEYLRLSYHGLRAKDKTFNATTKTDLDNSIGKINIIPQDIGRVILNMINNAFYAVSEKKKQAADGYEPTVSVITKKINNKIEIIVKDNGTGIPQKAFDKIFQPFFTTKPTGQGTGLGLSLSYDIITKGHGGELKVETKEGEYSKFIIILPV